jgi:drug/metabolite transporter (DMT)-like permease
MAIVSPLVCWLTPERSEINTYKASNTGYNRPYFWRKDANIMGEAAALLTAFSWTLSSLLFTSSGKTVGSLTTNRLRLLFAVVMLALVEWAVAGSPIPFTASSDRWFWLGLSGLVGLTLGDSFLMQAFVLIGPRLAMLIMAIVPVISTIMAWIFLGEKLALVEIAGILLSVAGVSWVILERSNDNGGQRTPRQFALGILCGLGGAIGQAVGLILAKKGLYGDFPALAAVVIRMLIAMLAMWAVTIVSGQLLPTLQALKNGAVVRTIAAGSFIGSLIGVWLSLVAVQRTYVGIASTLMALTPIMLLPFARWLLKEKVSVRALFGTFAAIAGVALIFMFS